MEALLATLRGFGVARLAAMACVMVAVVGFLIYTISRFTTPDMALLYGDLDLAEGSQIVARLEGMGTPVELRGGGTQIYVPSDQVPRLRMSMAEAGLPIGGSIGYEIFDRSDVLGSTNFVQDVNLLRALEGELSRTIRTIQNVSAARVHIVLPKRELFSREKQTPTASIVLKMRGINRLNPNQTRAIQNLVASSVPGLSSDQISIVDDKGTLLARGEGAEATATGLSLAIEESRIAHENNISRTIESLLEKSLGAGKVRSKVTVEMDMSRLTEQSETYDPDGQVVRSTQSSSDTESSQDTTKNTATTVQNNLPNAASGNTPGGAGSRSDGKKAEETVNYEISKTVKTQVKELGGVKRVSVAVLVDGTYTKGKDDKEAYAPRSKEELQQITKLVKAAVGFKADRGDSIEVVNLRFSTEKSSDFDFASDTIAGLERKDFIHIMETAVLVGVVLLVLLFVVKPILMHAIDHRALAAIGPHGKAIPMEDKTGTPDSLDVASLDQGETLDEDGNEVDLEEMTEVSNKQIIGSIRVAALKKLEELIDGQPEDAAMLLRTWMKNT